MNRLNLSPSPLSFFLHKYCLWLYEIYYFYQALLSTTANPKSAKRKKKQAEKAGPATAGEAAPPVPMEVEGQA